MNQDQLYYRNAKGEFELMPQGVSGQFLNGNPRANNETNYPKIMHEFLRAEELLDTCMRDEKFIDSIQRAADIMIDALKNGGKIITCGNGGSMCDAMHFASELTGKYREDRRPIAAIAISDPAYLTCTSNDMGYEYTFSRAIVALAKPEDVIVLITTSGNSENILMANQSTAHRGPKVVALTGNNGGKLSKYLTQIDVEICVPHTGYADRTQEIDIKVIHILCKLIEEAIKEK